MVDKADHVTMLIACDMGGIAGGTVATLHRLSKNAAEGRDGTVYGVHSNANYFTHHATAISLAIVTATAEAIERGVNREQERAQAHAPPARGRRRLSRATALTLGTRQPAGCLRRALTRSLVLSARVAPRAVKTVITRS